MPTARPIRRMTSAIDSSTGMNWLGIAINAVVVKTAVIASSSGIAAATTDPNTSSRITRVSGMAIIPAFASMLLNAAVVSRSVVTLPSSSTEKPGWRFSALSTAASIVAMYVSAWS